MTAERRMSVRRNVHHPGLMVGIDKSIIGPCTVCNVSATGARLKLEMSEGVPDEFELLLSRNAPLHRRCKVVWRSESNIGVRFVIFER
jgi:PilZ domain